jgi:hypothetical protein
MKMFGTFVPPYAGHLPIDFYQKRNIICLTDKRLNKKKKPSPFGEGLVKFTTCGEGGCPLSGA